MFLVDLENKGCIFHKRLVRPRFTIFSEKHSSLQRRIKSPYGTSCAQLPPGPTTVGLVLDNLAIVSSERPRWACTNAGGVKASHWLRLRSWNLSVQCFQKSSDKGEGRRKELTRIEDLKEPDGSIARVLNVMAHRSRDVSYRDVYRVPCMRYEKRVRTHISGLEIECACVRLGGKNCHPCFSLPIINKMVRFRG